MWLCCKLDQPYSINNIDKCYSKMFVDRHMCAYITVWIWYLGVCKWQYIYVCMYVWAQIPLRKSTWNTYLTPEQTLKQEFTYISKRDKWNWGVGYWCCLLNCSSVCEEKETCSCAQEHDCFVIAMIIHCGVKWYRMTSNACQGSLHVDKRQKILMHSEASKQTTISSYLCFMFSNKTMARHVWSTCWLFSLNDFLSSASTLSLTSESLCHSDQLSCCAQICTFTAVSIFDRVRILSHHWAENKFHSIFLCRLHQPARMSIISGERLTLMGSRD